jgi:hypothetical protein
MKSSTKPGFVSGLLSVAIHQRLKILSVPLSVSTLLSLVFDPAVLECTNRTLLIIVAHNSSLPSNHPATANRIDLLHNLTLPLPSDSVTARTHHHYVNFAVNSRHFEVSFNLKLPCTCTEKLINTSSHAIAIYK